MLEDKHLTKKQRKRLSKQKTTEQKEKNEGLKRIKTFGIWFIVLVTVILGGYNFIKWIYTPTVEVVSEPIELADNDWVKGDWENAKLTIIEYSDFQCPACEAYHYIVNRLAEEYSDSVRIVFRHFPLVTIHPNAFNAARAAEAAGKQGKFWEMHDKLFENQGDWVGETNPLDKFLGYAEELGLNTTKLEDDFSSNEIEGKINEHIFQANRLGFNSTPTFIINGQKIDNPEGYEVFKSLIEKKLAE